MPNSKDEPRSTPIPGTVEILGFTYVTGPKVNTLHLVILAVIDWIMRLLLGREQPAPTPPLDGKVLAIAKIDLLGDVLIMTPLLAQLRQQSPTTRLVLIVGSWGADAARLLLGEALCDAIVIYDPPTMSPARTSWFRKIHQWLSTLQQARTELRREKTDVYLDLRSSSPNGLLLARLARIPHKVGYPLRGYSYLLQQVLPYDPEVPMGQQYLDALDVLGLKSVPYEKPILQWRGQPSPLPATFSPTPPFIALHPFSRNARKMIAAPWWQQMLAQVPNRRIVVLGTRGDLANHELMTVLTNAGCDLSLVGQTTFLEAVACVSEASAFIGVDSVFSHVALAYDKPTYVAAIKGASYRLAFPGENAHLHYDEVNVDAGPADSLSPVWRQCRERLAENEMPVGSGNPV